MESKYMCNTPITEVCGMPEDSSETCDGMDESEERDTLSIGKLQHDIKMLSIKVLEKDMEIKGLRAEFAATKKLKLGFETDKMKPSQPTRNAEAQTEETSLRNQLSLVKQDGSDFGNQSSALMEKLEVLEQTNNVLKEELAKSKNDCTAALSRAIVGEEIQQGLQGELNGFRQSRGSELPVGRLEQLCKPELCPGRESVEVLNELRHHRREQDALHQRQPIAEVETRRLYTEPDREVCLISQQPDVLTKARVASLEVQLNAACAARDDALREVERLTEKFEAASKAIHEMDAARKEEVSRMEVQLAVVSCKLEAYEQVEVQLDRAIENFTSTEVMGREVESDALLRLTSLSKGDDVPFLPTLASRRLEHCIKISRQLAKSEELRRSIEAENRELRRSLKAAEDEVKRLTELLANVDKPTNCLASALVSRDSCINDLQMTKRKLENKLRRLYDCTRDIVAERNAMISDLKIFFERSNQGALEVTPADEAPPLLMQLRRKIRRAQP